ncbi:unnamed protein product, partial [Sphacelaria rigidula]
YAHADGCACVKTLVKAAEECTHPCYECTATLSQKTLHDLSAGNGEPAFIRCDLCFYDTRATLLSDFQRRLFKEKAPYASRNDDSTPRKAPRVSDNSLSPPGNQLFTPPTKISPPLEEKKNSTARQGSRPTATRSGAGS